MGHVSIEAASQESFLVGVLCLTMVATLCLVCEVTCFSTVLIHAKLRWDKHVPTALFSRSALD